MAAIPECAESALVVMLREELTRRRVFLSSDEERALTRPAQYDDETDLAWVRVRRRRSTFYGALRGRFLFDGKPLDEWRRHVADDEAAAGGPTFVSQIARQVLEWAVRTADRGAMIGGFAGRALRWLGLLVVLLGLFGCYQGAALGGAIVLVAGLALVLAGRVVGSLAAGRVAALTAPLRG